MSAERPTIGIRAWLDMLQEEADPDYRRQIASRVFLDSLRRQDQRDVHRLRPRVSLTTPPGEVHFFVTVAGRAERGMDVVFDPLSDVRTALPFTRIATDIFPEKLFSVESTRKLVPLEAIAIYPSTSKG